LDRFSAKDDLGDDALKNYLGVTYLLWEQLVSIKEVESCTIRVSSTSLGTDKVTVQLLQACWKSISKPLHSLFSRCLELNHFPYPWKYAKVAMIPKVGKKDKAFVRS
jgi:hypothetical protein